MCPIPDEVSSNDADGKKHSGPLRPLLERSSPCSSRQGRRVRFGSVSVVEVESFAELLRSLGATTGREVECDICGNVYPKAPGQMMRPFFSRVTHRVSKSSWMCSECLGAKLAAKQQLQRPNASGSRAPADAPTFPSPTSSSRKHSLFQVPAVQPMASVPPEVCRAPKHRPSHEHGEVPINSMDLAPQQRQSAGPLPETCSAMVPAPQRSGTPRMCTTRQNTTIERQSAPRPVSRPHSPATRAEGKYAEEVARNCKETKARLAQLADKALGLEEPAQASLRRYCTDGARMCDILSDCRTGFETPRRARQWEDEVARLQRVYLTGAHKILSCAERDQRAVARSPSPIARVAATPPRAVSPITHSPRAPAGRGPIKGLHGLAFGGGSHNVQPQRQQQHLPVAQTPNNFRRDTSSRAHLLPGANDDVAEPSRLSMGARLGGSPRRSDGLTSAFSLPDLAAVSARPPPSTHPRQQQQLQ